ncbi:MAG: CHAP domain-containing protein [Pseudolysinimonas sp.]
MAGIVGISVFGFSPVAIAAGTGTTCVGDQCDEGRWGAARADSFWGMYSGHNCTNYVAWRLSEDGVTEPPILLGNAATWAERAARVGITVDHTPSVGAVAQWDAHAGGNSYAGHVAYIEAVNDDGTITISEDYWHHGNQLGPLTFRTISPSKISNIIHFESSFDLALQVRQATLRTAGWQESTRRYEVEPNLIAATQMESGVPLVVATAGGRLVELADDVTATMTDTGIASTATSLAAVSRGSSAYVMTVQNGTLVMNLRTDDGWQQMPTGLEGIVGDITVVDEGTLTPTVLLSQSGNLYVIYMDTEGWHVYTTGSAVSGPIQAVIADGELNVFSLGDGNVLRTWWDGVTWHQENTGITADSVAAVASVETGVDLFVVTGGRLSELNLSATGWQVTELDLRAGTAIAVAAAGVTPTIFQVG